MAQDALRLPPALLSLILPGQPLHQRLKALGERAGIALPRTGEFLERLLPGPRGTQTQHVGQAPARLLTAVVRALGRRSLLAGGRAERRVALAVPRGRK